MSYRVLYMIPIIFLSINAFIPVSSAYTIFNLQPDNVCYEVWEGFNGDAVGNSTYDSINSKFIMWINDTSGSWGLAKLSRGIMPHYWGVRHAPLDSEFEIEKCLPTCDLVLDIDLKLVKYTAYDPGNSSTNVAIVLFFDGYREDYQLKCYQTELQFFSYYGDRIQKDQVWFFEWRNDSVAQFKLVDNLQPGVYKHYSINLMPYIVQMMDYYKLEQVKLKHVEIFTEAYKGFCEFEVYSARIHIEEGLYPHLLSDFSILIFIALLFSVIAILIISRKAISHN